MRLLDRSLPKRRRSQRRLTRRRSRRCSTGTWSRHGERVHVALRHGDGEETSLTYRHVAEQAHAAANGLRQAGLEPGERVAIMLPTSEASLLRFLACSTPAACDADLPPARPRVEEHLSDRPESFATPGGVPDRRARSLGHRAAVELQVESLRAVVSRTSWAKAAREPEARSAGRRTPHSFNTPPAARAIPRAWS